MCSITSEIQPNFNFFPATYTMSHPEFIDIKFKTEFESPIESIFFTYLRCSIEELEKLLDNPDNSTILDRCRVAAIGESDMFDPCRLSFVTTINLVNVNILQAAILSANIKAIRHIITKFPHQAKESCIGLWGGSSGHSYPRCYSSLSLAARSQHSNSLQMFTAVLPHGNINDPNFADVFYRKTSSDINITTLLASMCSVEKLSILFQHVIGGYERAILPTLKHTFNAIHTQLPFPLINLIGEYLSFYPNNITPEMVNYRTPQQYHGKNVVIYSPDSSFIDTLPPRNSISYHYPDGRGLNRDAPFIESNVPSIVGLPNDRNYRECLITPVYAAAFSHHSLAKRIETIRCLVIAGADLSAIFFTQKLVSSKKGIDKTFSLITLNPSIASALPELNYVPESNGVTQRIVSFFKNYLLRK